MGQSIDIVIAGVGGQGTVLASRVLAQAALEAGLVARTSETIGMAQREGTVQSHVRIGSGAFGPLIGHARGDVLLGFEPAEAIRAAALLNPSGLALVNLAPIRPVTVALGSAVYRQAEIEGYLRQLPFSVSLVDALGAAVAAGSFRAVNTVMLGALSATRRLPFGRSEILRVLLEHLPQRARAINECAFELGTRLMAPEV
jgi:indolepyruvate ferredoxin oxidoreductase beta subunit